ncbi:hypothetical protein A2U01_0062382, partial [Trifolium medium]|nr:hypothetical protein [Trifolium medium]
TATGVAPIMPLLKRNGVVYLQALRRSSQL